uniref:Uncharacterized protein n=1 Tax=Anguilla anguilla TaxID=7936 RepID=A0A0E9S8G1_ANGAN
MNRFMKFLLL